MLAHLVFWRLEWKRAYLKFPQVFAGAIALLFLAIAVALFASRALYGGAAVGRVAVGVVLPEDDLLAKRMASMVSSLDSVKSICDFQYVDRQEGLEKLKGGELYAVMDMPEGLIEGIMDGSNPPVRVLLPAGAGAESQIFRELTEAGAQILSAAQAGIYGGGQLYRSLSREGEIPQMEEELNAIFLSYSLPREDYFRHQQVGATGDVEVSVFYGISAYVLFLLMLAVPASGYLLPFPLNMRQKLNLAGIGGASRTVGKLSGLASLFFTLTLLTAGLMGALIWAVEGERPAWEAWGKPEGFLGLLLVCLAAASFVVFLYRAAGTLMGGVMALFLTVTVQHFLAGGFLPEVFLPPSLRVLAPAMPSKVLMDGVKMALAGAWDMAVAGKLGLLTMAGFSLTSLWERWER